VRVELLPAAPAVVCIMFCVHAANSLTYLRRDPTSSTGTDCVPLHLPTHPLCRRCKSASCWR
jgi:hypothetical protein